MSIKALQNAWNNFDSPGLKQMANVTYNSITVCMRLAFVGFATIGVYHSLPTTIQTAWHDIYTEVKQAIQVNAPKIKAPVARLWTNLARVATSYTEEERRIPTPDPEFGTLRATSKKCLMAFGVCSLGAGIMIYHKASSLFKK